MTRQLDVPEIREATLHVMLVDDEDDYHLITRMMLKRAGFQGRFSSFLDPAEAMDHLRQAGKMPDLLLLDINMPATDGFEFIARCAREQLLTTGGTTVVMCSSSNRPVDMERARQLNCIHDYIEKPLTIDQFNRLVLEHARRTETREKP